MMYSSTICKKGKGSTNFRSRAPACSWDSNTRAPLMLEEPLSGWHVGLVSHWGLI